MKEVLIKTMKWTWIIFAGVGTIIGVTVLFTQPITTLIKIILVVGGEVILALWMLIPYWLQRKKTEQAETNAKNMEQYRWDCQKQVDELSQIVSKYKSKYGDIND